MAAPLTKRHATLVANFAAAASAKSTTPLDFSQGSILLALAEATAGLGTWLQKLYVFALSVTRLASSRGIWVDTFISAFGMSRLGDVAATGAVNFSRFGPTDGTIAIPVGSQVGSADGSQVFTVYSDATNPAFTANGADGNPGYLLLAGASTVSVPVQAQTAGQAGNVNAQTITRLLSPVRGVDAVINIGAFTNGIDQESDAAVKARFILFIAALARGTEAAIRYAVASTRQGLSCQIVSVPGLVSVYVDDGTGAPPPADVQAAAGAVEAVRAAGIQAAVFGATQLLATPQMIVSVADGYDEDAVCSAVTAALILAINAIGFGVSLPYTRLAQIAYDASPGVTNVSAVLLNGTLADLKPGPGQSIKAGSPVVSPAQ